MPGYAVELVSKGVARDRSRLGGAGYVGGPGPPEELKRDSLVWGRVATTVAMACHGIKHALSYLMSMSSNIT